MDTDYGTEIEPEAYKSREIGQLKVACPEHSHKNKGLGSFASGLEFGNYVVT